MTSAHRGGFTDSVTRFWTFAAPACGTAVPAAVGLPSSQDEVIPRLKAHASDRVADIACGTGIFAVRISEELKP